MTQLKEELSSRGLPVKGKKAQLVPRLQEALGPNAKVYTTVITVTMISSTNWEYIAIKQTNESIILQ